MLVSYSLKPSMTGSNEKLLANCAPASIALVVMLERAVMAIVERARNLALTPSIVVAIESMLNFPAIC